MRRAALRVGELARRTGISVRTLHYYDEIGLLRPGRQGQAGYRLYGAREVARLQQIKSLQQLGFSLEEIGRCLTGQRLSPQEVIDLHITRLHERIALQQQLCGRLEAIAERFRAAEEVSVEEFIATIEGMSMFEQYYTPEQLAYLKERAAQVGQERIREVEQTEWPTLISQVREAIDRGADPTGEPVLAMARRWLALVAEFTGGDPGIERSLRTMYQQEPPDGELYGQRVDPRMREYMAYLGPAMARVKSER